MKFHRSCLLTALPSSNEPCPQELTALLWCEARQRNWIIPEEIVEFEYVLEKVSEGQETPIYNPRSSGCDTGVSFMAQDKGASSNLFGSWLRVIIKAYDRRIRDSVQESEAGD